MKTNIIQRYKYPVLEMIIILSDVTELRENIANKNNNKNNNNNKNSNINDDNSYNNSQSIKIISITNLQAQNPNKQINNIHKHVLTISYP